jgi:hypothetical protein
MPLKAEVDPPQVNAFVPTDRTLTAKVRLTPKDIDSARTAAIKKTPFIEFTLGQIREVSTAVKITIPPAQDVLKEYTITTATLGFCLSDNLQGKYEVQLLNPPTDLATVLIKATLTAKQAFEQQPFQMVLYVLDDDAKNANTEQRRIVFYNFPREFVRSDEIVLNQPPVQARFKLVPLSVGSVEGSGQ